jgi:phospholipase/carboxylesterase
MKVRTLSLVHRTLSVRAKQAQPKPPLLLLLHGIGSNEDDLFSLAPYLDERFLIVSARAPFVMGPGSFGWFNIEFTPRGILADMNQAEQSRALLIKFMDELIEAYNVDPACFFLLGFSQGAMMSLAAALSQPDKVAAIATLSGRFPSQVQTPDPEALRGMPVFVAHGIYDPVLPVEAGREAREKLEALGAALTYHEYPMGHEVSMESLRDLTAWLAATLDAKITSSPNS